MKIDSLQTNFTAGEISPLMVGRVDFNRYQNGVAKLRNFFVRPQGGISRRPGTVYVGAAKNASKTARLVRFVVSEEVAYLLEFGEQYVRIYQDCQQLQTSPGVAYEVTTPYMENDLANLYFSQSADVLYIFHPDFQTRTLSRYSQFDWRLATFETIDGPYLATTPPGVTLQISNVSDTATVTSNAATTFAVGDIGKYTRFREDDVWKLGLITAFTSDRIVTIKYLTNLLTYMPGTKFSSEADSRGTGAYGDIAPIANLTIIHPTISSVYSGVFGAYDINKFIRHPTATAGNADWYPTTAAAASSLTVGTAVTQPAGAGYTAVDTQLTVSNRVITATVTSSGAGTFAATDVGRHIRFNFSGRITWAKITAYVSDLQVTAQFYESIPLDTQMMLQTPGTAMSSTNLPILSNFGYCTDWKFGAWSSTTGWPSCGCFHEQRFVAARTDAEKQGIWFSRPDDYVDFSTTEFDGSVQDDNGITYALASGELNEIVWVSPGDVLLVGTIGNEWQVLPASTIKEPLTPTNFLANPQTSRGSKLGFRPIKADASTLFIQKSGAKIREMMFNFQIDKHESEDLTIASEHILREGSGCLDIAYQPEPLNTVYALRTDGKVACLTYERKQEVVAWSVLEFESATVESLVVIPAGDGTDDVFFLMHRTDNTGAAVHYIEKLTPIVYEDMEQMCFVDCAVEYEGSSTTTVTGLSHLEGKTVQVYADGSYRGETEVSSGSVTLTEAASHIFVGLPITSYLKTLPIPEGNRIGAGTSATKRVHKITANIFESVGFKHGPSLSDLIEEPFTDLTESVDDTPPLFTGLYPFQPNLDFSLAGSYYIVQDKPLPLTILSLAPSLKTNEQY